MLLSYESKPSFIKAKTEYKSAHWATLFNAFFTQWFLALGTSIHCTGILLHCQNLAGLALAQCIVFLIIINIPGSSKQISNKWCLASLFFNYYFEEQSTYAVLIYFLVYNTHMYIGQSDVTYIVKHMFRPLTTRSLIRKNTYFPGYCLAAPKNIFHQLYMYYYWYVTSRLKEGHELSKKNSSQGGRCGS